MTAVHVYSCEPNCLPEELTYDIYARIIIFQKTGKDKKENKIWKIRAVKQKEGRMCERGKKQEREAIEKGRGLSHGSG